MYVFIYAINNFIFIISFAFYFKLFIIYMCMYVCIWLLQFVVVVVLVVVNAVAITAFAGCNTKFFCRISLPLRHATLLCMYVCASLCVSVCVRMLLL